jgi:hypothetical protein
MLPAAAPPHLMRCPLQVNFWRYAATRVSDSPAFDGVLKSDAVPS